MSEQINKAFLDAANRALAGAAPLSGAKLTPLQELRHAVARYCPGFSMPAKITLAHVELKQRNGGFSITVPGVGVCFPITVMDWVIVESSCLLFILPPEKDGGYGHFFPLGALSAQSLMAIKKNRGPLIPQLTEKQGWVGQKFEHNEETYKAGKKEEKPRYFVANFKPTEDGRLSARIRGKVVINMGHRAPVAGLNLMVLIGERTNIIKAVVTNINGGDSEEDLMNKAGTEEKEGPHRNGKTHNERREGVLVSTIELAEDFDGAKVDPRSVLGFSTGETVKFVQILNAQRRLLAVRLHMLEPEKAKQDSVYAAMVANGWDEDFASGETINARARLINSAATRLAAELTSHPPVATTAAEQSDTPAQPASPVADNEEEPEAERTLS